MYKSNEQEQLEQILNESLHQLDRASHVISNCCSTKSSSSVYTSSSSSSSNTNAKRNNIPKYVIRIFSKF